MATRRLSGAATSSSVPDNGGDHSGGGGSAGGYVDDVFSTYLYEGTGSAQTITNGVDLDGEGGLVWLKNRNESGVTATHLLFDSERGITKYLQSNTTSPQSTDAGFHISSFNSDGFSLQNGGGGSNKAGIDYTSWTFRKAPKFFDVVTWTGDGVAGREIPHNLGVEPGMIIVKNITNGASDWRVYHRSLGATKNLLLNGANAALTQTGMWNDTEPTSTVFTVGDDGGTNGNAAAYDYVAYVFAHDDSDESMIKCGSFTGNPTTIDLGFEPQWMIAKKYDSTSSWQMFDAMRGWTADGGTVDLVADTDSSESDRLSRDYTQLKSDGVTFNGYGGSWIYMAIRRPNKPAEEFDPEELFGILDSIPANSGANNTVIPTDNEFDVIMGNPDYVRGNSMNMSSRHQGGKAVWTNSDRAEFTSPQFYLDYMKAFRQSIANGTDFLACTFKRQPGFFDVVAHTCDGDQGSLYPHNLGVVPDMVWRKERNNSSDWQVWVRAMPNNNDGADGGIYLNTDGQYYNGNTQWGWLTPPTDTHLSNGVFRTAGRDIVSYLFASVPGICDIGTFTGLGPNGNIVEVDCGFTNGARFVLVKRVDGTGNWMFWDSARGVSSTLSLNKTDAAGYENRYYQWPKGFKVNSYDLDGEEWNPGIDGAEYIYMAIA